MKLYYILSLILVAGCTHSPPKPGNNVPVFAPVVCEDYGEIESIDTLPVVFIPGTDREGNQLIGLRGDAYSNLALNSTKILNYIIEQTKVISYYKNCIENHNSIQPNEEGPPE